MLVLCKFIAREGAIHLRDMKIHGAFHHTLSPSSCCALALSRLAKCSSLELTSFAYCCRLISDLKALLSRYISTILSYLDNTHTTSLWIYNVYLNLSSTPTYHSITTYLRQAMNKSIRLWRQITWGRITFCKYLIYTYILRLEIRADIRNSKIYIVHRVITRITISTSIPESISHHCSHIFIISPLTKLTNTMLDAVPKPFIISRDSNPPPYEKLDDQLVLLPHKPQRQLN